MEELSNLISQYGFPIIAACGAGYMVYYVWKWTTEVVDPILNEAKVTLIALIDRVRMLDNDLIRLNQKLNVILQLREQELEESRKKKKDQTKD
jgi:hypothetical protein